MPSIHSRNDPSRAVGVLERCQSNSMWCAPGEQVVAFVPVAGPVPPGRENSSVPPWTEAAMSALRLSTYRKIHPGPLEEFVFYDHPSGRTRITAAMRWKKENMDILDEPSARPQPTVAPNSSARTP